MGTIVGTGASAPAVVAGETAEAQPAASPTVPTSIAVPTPTMGARAEDLQAVALAAIDGMTYLKTISAAGVRSCFPLFNNNILSTPSLSMQVGLVSANDKSTQFFEPPHGATMTKVTIYVDPLNATPPAGTKVKGEIWKHELATNAETQIGTTVTDPTTGASYGSAHSFDVTCSEVIDRTAYAYYIILDGEAGSGASSCTWIGSTYTAS